MNSNELNPNHKFQIAISIIVFVVLLVGTAWIYNKSTTTISTNKTPTDQEILSERLKTKVVLTPEEQAILNKRLTDKVILSPSDKAILEERLKSNN
jgi:type II secretory pathway component PulC